MPATPELTVQVPASLIEELRAWAQTARAAKVGGIGNLYSIIRDIDALLSQPTPTAKADRSIVQLAEGSTFYARQHGDRQERFWFLAAGMGVVSLDAVMAHANSIDPSTIRDVTLPKNAPS